MKFNLFKYLYFLIFINLSSFPVYAEEWFEVFLQENAKEKIKINIDIDSINSYGDHKIAKMTILPKLDFQIKYNQYKYFPEINNNTQGVYFVITHCKSNSLSFDQIDKLDINYPSSSKKNSWFIKEKGTIYLADKWVNSDKDSNLDPFSKYNNASGKKINSQKNIDEVFNFICNYKK